MIRIVEERDATAEERAITEWNTSIYCFRRSVLAPALRRSHARQRPGRVLPDRRRRGAARRRLPGRRRRGRRGRRAAGRQRPPPARASRGRVAAAHERRWLGLGVTMLDPERTYIDATVKLARRRHALPRHAAAGHDRDRRGRRDRTRTPGSSTARSAPAASSRRRSGAMPTSARARSSARTRCSSRAPTSRPGTRTGSFYTASAEDGSS